MDRLRDTIRKWDNVDRARMELRHWLHSRQEELQEMENNPSKLHAEAAELDIQRLQVGRWLFLLPICLFLLFIFRDT